MNRFSAWLCTAVFGSIFLAGCQHSPSQFADAHALAGSVEGRSGGCEQVFLIPSTSHNDRLIRRQFGAGDKGEFVYRLDGFKGDRAPDDNSTGAVKAVGPEGVMTTRCSLTSRFAFSNVDPGMYYVTTSKVFNSVDSSIVGFGVNGAIYAPSVTTFYKVGLMRRVVVEPGATQHLEMITSQATRAKIV